MLNNTKDILTLKELQELLHIGKNTALRLVQSGEIEALAQNPKIRAVTVNASPYAVGFYEKSGFVPLDKEQKANGIRFTPMRKMI